MSRSATFYRVLSRRARALQASAIAAAAPEPSVIPAAGEPATVKTRRNRTKSNT